MTGALAATLVLALVTGPSAAERWRPPELRVRPPPPAANFEEVLDIALSYLGRPYVMGGVGSPAFDCSGFMCRVYAESGYGIPRVSRDQVRAGRGVPVDALAPGDLLFFAERGRPISHVGMYIGDGELVHASSGQGKVVVARLSSRWFQRRLVAARRVLTSSVGGTFAPSERPSTYVAPTTELVEHTGDSILAPMLRRPARRSPPSYGPELLRTALTSVGVRSAFVSEAQSFAPVLVPEVRVTMESIALSAEVAVPIRFPLDDRPSVGTFDTFADYVRFLRHLSLGVEDADLELSLTRFEDVSLLGGFVIDHLVPASEVRGVAGLVVGRSPLTFFGRLRDDGFVAEALIDDVGDPAILGVGGRAKIPSTPLAIGLGTSTDQRGRVDAGRRAVNHLEAELRASVVNERAWSFDAHLDVGATTSLDRLGTGAVLAIEGEHRFYGPGASSVTLELEAGYAGARFVPHFFGPTYATERRAHLVQLTQTAGRPVLGAELTLQLDKVLAKVGYGQSVGQDKAAIDRRIEAVLEAQSIAAFGTSVLDLRLVYAARAPFGPEPTLDVLQGGARLRLFGWLFVEAYVAKGQDWEGGAGVTVAWIP